MELWVGTLVCQVVGLVSQVEGQTVDNNTRWGGIVFWNWCSCDSYFTVHFNVLEDMFSPVYNARIQWDSELVVKSLEILSKGYERGGETHRMFVPSYCLYWATIATKRPPSHSPTPRPTAVDNRRVNLCTFTFKLNSYLEVFYSSNDGRGLRTTQLFSSRIKPVAFTNFTPRSIYEFYPYNG